MQVTTIIFVHYAPNDARSELGRRSFASLHESVKHLLVEMIVVDNGGSMEDSQFFLQQVEEGNITHYIRNTSNLWFGYARNQGLDMSTGEYICIVDNDLVYKEGWLEDCLNSIDKAPREKLMATPLAVDRAHIDERFYREPVEIDGKLHPTNSWAGSNCWVMKREHYEALKGFLNHTIAGTKWSRRASQAGYAYIIPMEPWVEHLGLRKTPYEGYSKYRDDKRLIIKEYINGETERLN